MDLKNFRKDLVLLSTTSAARRVSATSSTAAGSASTRLPDLDANANAIAIETIKLEHEGWERDLDMPEPDENAAVPARESA